MKYLVDTCGWIEWLVNGHLAQSYSHYLRNPAQLLVPTLVQYELYKWVCREKNANFAIEVIGLTEEGTVLPLDTNLALYAVDISKKYQLAMADAIIYASRQADAVLVTSDKHFKDLPHVKFFAKNK